MDNTKRRAGWRVVLRNEKHEFSSVRQAAQKGGPADCTAGRASGLHIQASRRTALFCRPPRPFPQPSGPPFCATRRPSNWYLLTRDDHGAGVPVWSLAGVWIFAGAAAGVHILSSRRSRSRSQH